MCSGLLVAAGADVLAAGRRAEERHGDDADDGDEGHEQGVLHQGGAALGVAAAGPDVAGHEVVGAEHGSDLQSQVRLSSRRIEVETLADAKALYIIHRYAVLVK